MTSAITLDATALACGALREQLSEPPTERLALDGPELTWQSLDILLSADPQRVWSHLDEQDRAGLIEHGWVDTTGQLSPEAETWADDLQHDPVAWALSSVETAGEHCGTILLGTQVALIRVEARVRPWADITRPASRRCTAQVIPASALPLFLGRWGGLEPAWSLESQRCEVDTDLVEARLKDPRTPAPVDADAALAAMWANPWRLWRVSCPARQVELQFLSAGDRGQFLVTAADDPAQLRIVARPGTLVWGRLIEAGRWRDPEEWW